MKARVMKLPSSSLAALLLLLAATLVVTAQDIPAGAWAGTWMAGAKSKFPGPPPQADQVTIQADGSVAVHVVSSDGKTTDWSYKPQVGAFVPIQGRDNVTVKIIKVNDYRLDQVWNSKGKTSHSHSTLSKDGKTQIFYAAPGKDKDGKPFQEIVVYEKQPG
jgi:anti-sigma factor RsiW